MGLFSRKRRNPKPDAAPPTAGAPSGQAFDVGATGDFDLATIDLPRVEVTPELEVAAERMTVRTYTACDEHIAPSIAPMTPFVLAVEDEPTMLVKLAGMSYAEGAELARAVAADESLAVAAYRSLPTYPVFILGLFVYDAPGDPMRFEGYRDVTTIDVQDFVVALGRNGGRGQVRLYSESAELLAVGRFALRMPPFQQVDFPYATTPNELHELWQLLQLSAGWYKSLPATARDFETAVETHMAKEPPL
jgi:hypothetical protein